MVFFLSVDIMSEGFFFLSVYIMNYGFSKYQIWYIGS